MDAHGIHVIHQSFIVTEHYFHADWGFPQSNRGASLFAFHRSRPLSSVITSQAPMDFIEDRQPTMKRRKVNGRSEPDPNDVHTLVASVQVASTHSDLAASQLSRLERLESSLLIQTFSFLSISDVGCICSLLSKTLAVPAGASPLWDQLALLLWKDKNFIPGRAKELRESALPKEAVQFSLQDAKRTIISPQELCSIRWEFRFKPEAGPGWCTADPFWSGKPPRAIIFEPNGSMFFEDYRGVHMYWRYVPQTAGRSGPWGSFLRARIDGVDVPSYVVHRNPDNWGFVLESCWVFLLSWKMPLLSEGGDKLPEVVSVQDQWDEAMGYNFYAHGGGLVVPGQAQGDDAEGSGAEDPDEDGTQEEHQAPETNQTSQEA